MSTTSNNSNNTSAVASPAASSASNEPTSPSTIATPAQATPTPATTGAGQAAAGPKRPRRRAPTAERRATHNAVERARRETLNGRFLALASLLPPLRVIRRPSKSAIVNSSIATVNAARRHRVLAAQTLKGMMREAEALRKEVNEWRARARIPTLEAPMRSEADAAALESVLRGEVEELDVDLDVIGEFDEEGEFDDENGGMGYDEDVKPQMRIKTTTTGNEGRFAYDASNAAGVSLSLSPLSMSPMSAAPMPAPMSAVSMPSPGGSDGSYEGPRTPPTPSSGVVPVGMYRNKPSVYNQQPQSQYHGQQQKPIPAPINTGSGAGASYDLGLGLDLGLFAPQQQQYAGYPTQDAYFAPNPNVGGYASGGWAAVNPQHPAYHHGQQAQMYGHGQHGQYMQHGF